MRNVKRTFFIELFLLLLEIIWQTMKSPMSDMLLLFRKMVILVGKYC